MQRVPQPPQWALVVSEMHSPSHHVVPGAQQFPLEHTSVPQGMSQPPQWELLMVVSTQPASPQHVCPAVQRTPQPPQFESLVIGTHAPQHWPVLPQSSSQDVHAASRSTQLPPQHR